MTYRGKVFIVFTLLIINDLSAYTIPYIFCKVFTSLVIRDLSVYINDNVTVRALLKSKQAFLKAANQTAG
jgi:NhaP-type Na+/H+ and K+/H+ antiporter